MAHSIGKQLQQARLARQLSIEEVSRATRIRPDKLLDLEEDNYSNFPSMSYAKGFLLLYARHLGVDVRDYAETLHTPNPVSSDDYEYLSAAAEGPPPPPARRPYHFAPRREHTILPVIVFAVLAALVVGVIYLVVNFQRLGSLDAIADKNGSPAPAASAAISTLPAPAVPAASPMAAAATPMPVASAIPIARAIPVNPAAEPSATPVAPPPPVAAAPTPAATPAAPEMRTEPPAIVAAQPMAAPAESPLPPQPNPAPTFDPTREVRRALPVDATPPADAAASPSPAANDAGDAVSAIVPTSATGGIKQVVILPIRKTLVTVRQDVADSAPIFEDWLYPGDGPLKLRGHKFWIQVQDPGAVQITQDGRPLPSGQSAIAIE